MPSSSDWLERLVEVRALVALGAGAGEHVAGAALLDEGALAGDQVRLALHHATGGQAGCGQHGGGAQRQVPPSHARNPIRQGCGNASSSPLRGREHRAGDAVPRPALARDRHDRLPRGGADVVRRAQPAGQAGGQLAHRVRPDREGQPVARRRRDALRERLGDLGQARVARHDRQRPGRRALGGDHPERLRERARRHQRLGRRQQVGQLVVLQAAREGDALEPRVAARRVVEEGRQLGSRGRPRCAARARRDVPAPGQRSSSSAVAPGAEADDHQPRVGVLARAPAARRPAAARRPWRRSACRRRRPAGRRRR